MRRLLLPVSLVFAFAGMCGGAPTEEKKNDDPVVVPVHDDDDGKEEENWCCEYQDAEGSKQYALTDGPAECNTKFADQEGRWVSGNQCIPCCCKTANDSEDPEKGDAFELTTPKSCSTTSGECLAGNAKECGGTGDEPEKGGNNGLPAGKTRPPSRGKPQTAGPGGGH